MKSALNRSIFSMAVAIVAASAAGQAWALPANGLAAVNAGNPSGHVQQVRHRCYIDEDGDHYCPRHYYAPYTYSYDYAPGFSLYIGTDRWRGDGYRWRSHRDDWRQPLSLRERR